MSACRAATGILSVARAECRCQVDHPLAEGRSDCRRCRGRTLTPTTAASERNGAALHRRVPQLVSIEIEYEFRVLRYGEPAAGRQLTLELAGTPSGVTECHETQLRTF